MKKLKIEAGQHRIAQMVPEAQKLAKIRVGPCLRKVLIGCRSAAKQRHSSAQHPHSFYAVFGC
jgi:hypothetical protein